MHRLITLSVASFAAVASIGSVLAASSPSRPSSNTCRPIVCANGRTYPTCTSQGYPINYFADPCRYNGGRR